MHKAHILYNCAVRMGPLHAVVLRAVFEAIDLREAREKSEFLLTTRKYGCPRGTAMVQQASLAFYIKGRH